MKLPEFKAALFDLDGTLLHSMRYWRITPLEFALAHDFRPTADEMDRMFTMSSRKLAMEMCEKRGLEIPMQDVMHELETFVYHHYLFDAKPKKDARKVLDLIQHRGIPMCIGTGTPREYAREGLAKHDMLKYFEFVTDGYEFGMNKYDPGYFELMASKLGVRPEEMCVFEDALYSIRSAKAAGCSVLAIEDASQVLDREEIMSMSDVYIREYAELDEIRTGEV